MISFKTKQQQQKTKQKKPQLSNCYGQVSEWVIKFNGLFGQQTSGSM